MFSWTKVDRSGSICLRVPEALQGSSKVDEIFGMSVKADMYIEKMNANGFSSPEYQLFAQMWVSE